MGGICADKSGAFTTQRTVAFPMFIGAQMIMDGRISKRGIIGPSEVPFEPFISELRKRKLDISRKVEVWDGRVEPGGE
jgi:saccharopine dehydrogenase-like NADP-dependent oxidoreductase